MKKQYLFSACLVFIILFCINSCKKENIPQQGQQGYPVIRQSFTEEFEAFGNLESKGWVMKDNSPLSSSSGPNADWGPGLFSYDKGGVWHGFSAFSSGSSPHEYIYSYVIAGGSNLSISSWLVSPVLSVKNGDKISFYTRGDTAAVYTNRMQVLLNISSSPFIGGGISSTGSFTNVIFDINSSQIQSGYPVNWTKYEHTFSGLSGNTSTRVAFRHYLLNSSNPAGGIGIDQFRFQVN